MTTHIITADGTHFVPEARFAKRRRRILFGTLGTLAAPFIIAALIGLYLAATGQASPMLREDDTIKVPTNCWVETTPHAETLIVDCD